MNKPLLLLTTCGTSILTGGAPPDTTAWLNKIANKSTAELDDVERTHLAQMVAIKATALCSASEAEQRELSAELNGIAAVLAAWRPSRVQHLLVHSDTAAGMATAQVVANVLRQRGAEPQLVTTGGLRTDSNADLRAALPDLTSKIRTFTEPHRAAGGDVVFNLTGGFKSVNAYLQAIGMFVADVCVFLFLGATELMRIPRVPVREFAAEELRPHREVFRRLAMGYEVSAEAALAVPEALLFEIDGNVHMSPWADVLWDRHRSTLYADELLPPLSYRLALDPRLAAQFKDASADARVRINTAIDEAGVQVDGRRWAKRSYELKKLSHAKAKPPYTHEIDVGMNTGRCRLFCCWVGDQLEVGELDVALH